MHRWVHAGRSILQRLTPLLLWSAYGLGLLLGMVYGSKLLGLDLFVVTRHSLPPPWRWLPLGFKNYVVIYNTLHFSLIAVLGIVYWSVPIWRRVLLKVCVLAGNAAAVSLMVVERLGVREGPRAMGVELVFYAGLAFAAIVVVEILVCFVALVLLMWLLRALFYKISRQITQRPSRW